MIEMKSKNSNSMYKNKIFFSLDRLKANEEFIQQN